MSRIALIHALEQSVLPTRRAFAALWPEATIFDLLDTSLSADHAHIGVLDAAMMGRFASLGAYARGTSGLGGRTSAILFTCSAFGPAIEEVKARLDVPVLRPNEAAFEHALARGNRIGLVVTFPPSLAPLRAELEAMAEARHQQISIEPRIAPGALAALSAGHEAEHDRLIAEASRDLDVDVIILGQFSMARAQQAVAALNPALVLTTPDSAVEKLRQMLAVR